MHKLFNVLFPNVYKTRHKNFLYVGLYLPVLSNLHHKALWSTGHKVVRVLCKC